MTGRNLTVGFARPRSLWWGRPRQLIRPHVGVYGPGNLRQYNQLNYKTPSFPCMHSFVTAAEPKVYCGFISPHLDDLPTARSLTAIQEVSSSGLLKLESTRHDVAMAQPAKGKSIARDPPPSLFLHPSPAASHASLPGLLGSLPSSQPQVSGQQAVTRPSMQRGASALSSRDPVALTSPREAPQSGHPSFRPPKDPSVNQTLNLGRPLQLRRGESTRATDRTDALWAEMQATLEEVELSASGGTRIFGPDHDRKLGELRMAQIALAQAWARSEADEAIETRGGSVGEGRNLRASTGTDIGADGGKTDGAAGGTDGAAKSTAGTGSVRPASSGAGAGTGTGGQEKLGAKLEEETEADILLARKRREANDRYFQRVNQGVLDVVAKLEDVAVAMRAVEQESKDIWADESVPGSAHGSTKT